MAMATAHRTIADRLRWQKPSRGKVRWHDGHTSMAKDKRLGGEALLHDQGAECSGDHEQVVRE